MKKLLLILVALLFLNCEKDNLNLIPIQIFVTTDSDVPYEYITSEMGDTYEMGTLHKIRATSGPGFRFLGWRKMKELYCSYQPIVDPDDYEVMYIYADDDYMGNCNNGLSRLWITAEYIEVFD